MNKPPISFILQFQSNEGADYFGPHINKQRNEWLDDESLILLLFLVFWLKQARSTNMVKEKN